MNSVRAILRPFCGTSRISAAPSAPACRAPAASATRTRPSCTAFRQRRPGGAGSGSWLSLYRMVSRSARSNPRCEQQPWCCGRLCSLSYMDAAGLHRDWNEEAWGHRWLWPRLSWCLMVKTAAKSTSHVSSSSLRWSMTATVRSQGRSRQSLRRRAPFGRHCMALPRGQCTKGSKLPCYCLDAEIVPCLSADASLLPRGQDTRVVGATALMFHDRRVSLAKMKQLSPPLQTSQLDYSLWLARSPPEGLEHERAAFIWWTSTHYKMRRCANSLMWEQTVHYRQRSQLAAFQSRILNEQGGKASAS